MPLLVVYWCLSRLMRHCFQGRWIYLPVSGRFRLVWKCNLFDYSTCSTLTKRLEKKLDGNYTRILRAILNKSWRQHPTRHQLYVHLPPITKTIQTRRTRHAGHCWRSKDELRSDVLQWTPAYSREKAGRPARTYILQLCEDTGCIYEDLPEAMNDREKWRERVRDIRASGTTWWYDDLNNIANHENSDLSHSFFSKIGPIRLKKKDVLKIIPYFGPASWILFKAKSYLCIYIRYIRFENE